MAFNFSKLSILVVDDNQHMRQLVCTVLKTMGVGTVTKADSGAAALKLIRQETPDIILVDWLMEPMDGLEMTRVIRNDPSCPARLAPVILMTGYSAHTRVVAARDLGVTEFLIKPFTAEALAKRIAHVIVQPRDFVIAPKFNGPDRRRRADDNYGGPRRRDVESD